LYKRLGRLQRQSSHPNTVIATEDKEHFKFNNGYFGGEEKNPCLCKKSIPGLSAHSSQSLY
jgi:hypothetical protein